LPTRTAREYPTMSPQGFPVGTELRIVVSPLSAVMWSS
jgi:hypothetical protein